MAVIANAVKQSAGLIKKNLNGCHCERSEAICLIFRKNFELSTLSSNFLHQSNRLLRYARNDKAHSFSIIPTCKNSKKSLI